MVLKISPAQLVMLLLLIQKQCTANRKHASTGKKMLFLAH
jgi:hypothetical protein